MTAATPFGEHDLPSPLGEHDFPSVIESDIDLGRVDPALRPILAKVPAIDVSAATLPLIRSLRQDQLLPEPAPQPVERRIAGLDGDPDVAILVTDGRRGRGGRPAVLHLHGGGFVLGSAAQEAVLAQAYAEAIGGVVVSVDYRLAPETPYPGALRDNYAALSWLHRNAESLGVDRDRIAVAGASAGGGHAAMLAILARERGEYPVAYLLLTYPMLDDRTGSAPGASGHILWTAASNRFGWAALLGQESAAARDGIVPARIGDLGGLPPTFIGVGEIDLFADEDATFARRLSAAGVPTELHVVPGAYHGFDRLAPGTAIASAFWQNLLAALRRGVGVAQEAEEEVIFSS
jgi:acetyl esterase/lipase